MTLAVSNFEQHSDEWFAARRGIVTASVVGQLITPALKVANNDTSRGVTLTLIAERITGNTDPTYASRDMERGTFDEPIARDAYRDNIAPVDEVGFMVENQWGYPIGYSPDGLVGTDGLIEIKSRNQKAQLATILSSNVPAYNMAQLQTGLLVSGRSWIDYVSYCSGMPLWTKRVYPDPDWQETIISAVAQFEATATSTIAEYSKQAAGLPATERVTDIFEEMRIA